MHSAHSIDCDKAGGERHSFVIPLTAKVNVIIEIGSKSIGFACGLRVAGYIFVSNVSGIAPVEVGDKVG